MAVLLYGKTSAGKDSVVLVSSGGQLSVDSELPSAAALADSVANPTAPSVGAMLSIFDGTNWNRWLAPSQLGDATTPRGAGAVGLYLYSGASTIWDRMHNNKEGALLASAARTATANSTDQVNYNGRGVSLILNVTVAPGVETLTVAIQAKDPISAAYVTLTAFSTIVATGAYGYMLYPGAVQTISTAWQVQGVALPRTWRAVVTHSAASSWTYSLSYSVIL